MSTDPGTVVRYLIEERLRLLVDHVLKHDSDARQRLDSIENP